jgi:hypothetical protein
MLVELKNFDFPRLIVTLDAGLPVDFAGQFGELAYFLLAYYTAPSHSAT